MEVIGFRQPSLSDIRNWMNDAWPLAICVGGITYSYLAGFFLHGSTVRGLAWSGLILELAGLGIVFLGLSRVQSLFGRQTPLDQMWSWLVRGSRMFVKRRVSLQVSPSQINVVTHPAHIRVWRTIDPDAEIQVRLDAIERNLGILDERTTGLRKDLQEEAKERREAISEAVAEVSGGTEKLRALMTDVSAGEITWEVIGLVWIASGIAFATVPEDILSLLGLAL